MFSMYKYISIIHGITKEISKIISKSVIYEFWPTIKLFNPKSTSHKIGLF